ncbi:MAG: tetratricopeptide repeat protein [Muribaculaceae bacterium]|nr:tetratricopeptide repeat protein [Muribaculaceae bacterium]
MIALFKRIAVLCLLSLLHFNIASGSSSRYLELVDSVDYYISKELWNMAEQKIMEALRLEPANFSNSLLLNNLGIVRSHKKEYDKAVEAYTLGISMAPSSTVLYNNRARAYLMLDSVHTALKDVDFSLSIDSIQEWPLQTMGYMYLYDNDITNAEKVFNFLKLKFPENSFAYAGLADIQERLGNRENALQLYGKSLELNPDEPEIMVSEIFLLIDLEKFSEARSKIKRGISLFPEDPMFYLLRGYLHRLNYRQQEAQADKKTAIDKGLDPAYVSRFIP